jgi:hypothetical protein
MEAVDGLFVSGLPLGCCADLSPSHTRGRSYVHRTVRVVHSTVRKEYIGVRYAISKFRFSARAAMNFRGFCRQCQDGMPFGEVMPQARYEMGFGD